MTSVRLGDEMGQASCPSLWNLQASNGLSGHASGFTLPTFLREQITGFKSLLSAGFSWTVNEHIIELFINQKNDGFCIEAQA